MAHKQDRIPALDPTAPGIYRRIIDTAHALRVAERADVEVHYNTLRMLRRIRMQAAAEVSDARIDAEREWPRRKSKAKIR